ncbi:MAG: DUF4214 domain-containing protein [Sulfurimonas sp.]|jgi:hypothetical protein
MDTFYYEDTYEQNDSFLEAKELQFGSYELGGNDEDWFKIDVENGMLYIDMTPSSSVDLNMVLYNSSQQVVAANFAAGEESIAYSVPTSGSYYLSISPTSTNTTNYTLEITQSQNTSGDDIYDASSGGNDTIATASLLSSPINTLANLKAYDHDWYKVNLSPGEFYIDVTDGLFVEVFNSEQTRIMDSINAGGTHFSIEMLEAGDYYISVSGSGGATYSLETFSNTVWTQELDFGPIRDASVSLFDIDKDGEDEIFVATSKALDGDLNEIRPAGLICLEADGTIKWTQTFAAISGVDPQTGKTYNTTSVSTAPFFSDLDGDDNIDIVIGVGGDTYGEAGADVVGQPGDKGGVYALNSDGSIKWFHESLDIIGGATNTGDERPDGVYSSPVVFDIDVDGVKEVIYGGWDQSLWILDGRTGVSERNVHLADTIWSTPKIADINEDGVFEILISADITENSDAQTQTGGIFHVISADGTQNIAGFNTSVGNPSYTFLNGKWEEQALWSSPVTGDIDGDGHLEIAYGTGNFFHDDRGEYIQIWNHDGSNMLNLSTVGRTFATPLITDLDGNGTNEIVATTLDGYVFAWDANGTQLFGTQTLSFGASTPSPIFSSPIAVDLTNDGKKEILYAQGTQIVVVDYQGNVLSDFNNREMVFESYKGSIAAKDIDDDGVVDIISGGTTASKDQAVVYRFVFEDTQQDDFTNDRYQFHQSTTSVENFVERFYEKVLGREAEAGGKIYWTDSLVTGVQTGADVAQGFIFSQEFTNQDLNDDDYLDVLYSAFFDREADSGGLDYWKEQIAAGKSRAEVLDGFIYSQEFKNLCATYSIMPSRE